MSSVLQKIKFDVPVDVVVALRSHDAIEVTFTAVSEIYDDGDWITLIKTDGTFAKISNDIHYLNVVKELD